MRYFLLSCLLLLSVSAAGQLSQFRMVGSGSWGTVDDSTHFSTVTFFSDLTANSFLPTGITDTMLVFTQRGQRYRIDSVGAKTFSTAVLYVVEVGGDWAKPSGQVLVYEDQGRATVPSIPFGSTGATAKLQEAVVTYNAGINIGVNTTQLSDSITAARSYADNKDAVLSTRISRTGADLDTINQASHGFSAGDPVWKSGDYVLSLDTGLVTRVDGVVVDSIDANFFTFQRVGKFTLTGHGFTIDQQLYVQPDGSYSTADTVNSLVYGFAIDANTIQIGATTEGIRSISNYFDNSLAGRASTKQAMLDSLAGFQSFKNISAIDVSSPSVGYTIENRSTGDKYKVVSDTIAGLAVDNNFQRALGSNYIIKTSPHVFEFSNQNVSAAVTSGIASYNKNFVYNLSISNSSDYTVTLPLISAVDTNTVIKITVSDSSDNDYIIQPAGGVINLGAGRYANKYRVSDNEEIELRVDGAYWSLVSTNFKPEEDWQYKATALQYERYGGYKSLPAPILSSIQDDSISVIKKVNKAPWGENLAKRSGEISQFPFWNTNSGRTILKNDQLIAPSGERDGNRVLPNHATPSFLYMPNVGGSGGDAYDLWEANTTYTMSFWVSVVSGDTSYIIPTVPNSTISTNTDTIHITNTNWVRNSITFTTNGSIAARANITFTISPNDSLNFWNLQIERTSQASPDIITTTNSKTHQDTTYLCLIPINGKISYSQSKITGYNANTIIQSQIDYCDALPGCNEVVIDESVEFFSGITVPDNFTLSGGAKSSQITARLDDPTENLITLGNLTDPYNENIIVKDLSITASKPAKSAINYSSGLELRIDNVTINGTSNRYFDHGIYEPIDGNRSIDSEYNKIIISGCDTAIYSTMQASSHIRKLTIRDECEYGVYQVNGGGFRAYDMILEKIDKSGIVFDGDELHLYGVRIEDVPNTTDYPTFDIRGGDIFSVKNSNLGPVHSFAADTAVLKIDDVDKVIVSETKMITLGLGTPISTTANTGTLWWNNNQGAANTVNESKIDDATLFFYFDNPDDRTIIPRQIIDDATISNPYIEESFMDGDIEFFDDTLKLVGANNLLKRSQSITQFPFWNANSSVIFTAGQSDPFGGTTASKVVWDGSGTSFLYIRTSGGTAFTFEPDTWYNLSFYGKLINATDTSWVYPEFQSGALPIEVLSEEGDSLHFSTSWQRKGWTFKTPEDITGLDRIQFFIAERDSFLFAAPQLSKGKYVKKYVPTTASENVPYTGVVFRGTGEFTDTLFTSKIADSSGSVGTSGQIPVSNGSEWNWASPSYGEAYIDYIDPDSVTVVTAGTLYDFTDVSEGSSSSDVTVSTTTGRLTYTGTTEKLFLITWTATVTSNANNENLVGTVMDNGATITRIRWEEEGTASGDRHSVSASGFFSMGENDWAQPKLTSQSNGTQIEVITMSFRIQEVR